MTLRCERCMRFHDEKYTVCPYCGYVEEEAETQPYMLQSGMKLNNRYEVGTVIDFGGFGNIYTAWDTKLEQIVAIKEYYQASIVTRVPGTKDVILSQRKIEQEYRHHIERFLEEARTMARFNGEKNLVFIYDYFEENNTAYLVMEYLDGVNLRSYLKSHGGKIDTESIVTILLSVIDALETVHATGILHRDISPDNIFLCKNGEVKLIDFGAARLSDFDTDKEVSMVLKPGYAPPEQYETKSRQGPYTDIYALGATMYRALTGVVPDESSNRLVEDKVKRPREINADIPEYIDACLTRAMSLSPVIRFQTADEFRNAILHQKTVLSEREELSRRRRIRAVLISAVAGVILISTAVNYAQYKSRQNAVELAETTVNVWIPVESGGDSHDMYMQMLEEFSADYPHVSIDVHDIPAEQYKERLQKAMGTEDYPDLFFVEGTGDTEEFGAEPLSDIYELLNASDFIYYKEANRISKDFNCIPLGMVLPVKYENEYSEKIAANNALQLFLEEEDASYLGGTDDYKDIQNALSGKYVVDTVSEKKPKGRFTDYWCVSDGAAENNKAAAKRILYYWMGESAQDILHIRNDGALPLNRNMLSVYLEVNPELSFVTDYIKYVEITSMSEEAYEEYLEALAEREVK